MEIFEFAQTLLFSGRLEHKLLDPGQITDGNPGRAFAPPAQPTRAPELAFRSREIKAAPFPRLRDLERAESTKIALHHFANHELLAIELMALALLRYVDAPTAFRLGLVETIRDEQEHLRLYIERIASLGGALGEYPLNGFLWHSMSNIETPLAFVASMSLTFEQANLDYADDFRRAFARVGDEASSAILKRILRDEIGHVRFGTRWLNVWRTPDEDDWAAYLRALPSNLSARRARGPRFLVSARRAAGLSDRFIEELRVFSHTRGRPPRVFVFNPTCEDDIARATRSGSTHSPKQTAALDALKSDLAPLMMFLADESDVVEVPRRPSNAHLTHLIRAGFTLPEFREPDAPWPESKIAALVPWGVSPHLRTNASRWPPAATPLPSFDEARAFSKLSAATWLRSFLDDNPDCRHLFGDASEVGNAASTFDEVVSVAQAFWARGQRVLIKAPFSSSGRHRIVLATPAALSAPTARAFIERHLGHLGHLETTVEHKEPIDRAELANPVERADHTQRVDRALLIEPYLDRVMDLSLTFFVTPQGTAHSVELTRFFTSPSGRYLGHRLGSSSAFFDAPTSLLRDLQVSAKKDEQFDRRLGRVAQYVAHQLALLGHEGPAGVDVLVHRAEDGRHIVKPIVEVNPRFTMGHIARALAGRLAPGQIGEWRHLRVRDLKDAGLAPPPVLAQELERAFPLTLAPAAPRRLASGVVFTNDPEQATAILSVLAVGPPCIEHLTAITSLASLTT
ncbi:MAG: DUF455 family protein [Deltaproteobacteria bacterium]|nr:DUF455 family protein [Deltaproteobacteria bacterium]